MHKFEILQAFQNKHDFLGVGSCHSNQILIVYFVYTAQIIGDKHEIPLMFFYSDLESVAESF